MGHREAAPLQRVPDKSNICDAREAWVINVGQAQKAPSADAGTVSSTPSARSESALNFFKVAWKFLRQRIFFEYFRQFVVKATKVGDFAVEADKLPPLWRSDDVRSCGKKFRAALYRRLQREEKGGVRSGSETREESPPDSESIRPFIPRVGSSTQTAQKRQCFTGLLLLRALVDVFAFDFLCCLAIDCINAFLTVTSVNFTKRLLESLEGGSSGTFSFLRHSFPPLMLAFVVELGLILLEPQLKFLQHRIQMRIEGAMASSLACSVLGSSTAAADAIAPREETFSSKCAEKNSAYSILILDIPSGARCVSWLTELCCQPISLLVYILSMYPQLGASPLVGITFLIIVFVIITSIEVINGFLKRSLLHQRDIRVDESHEFLSQVRTLRLVGWDGVAAKRIDAAREKELAVRTRRMYLHSISWSLSESIKTMTCGVVFTWFIWKERGVAFKASVAIPLLEAVIKISKPLRRSSFLLHSIVEGWVSVGRCESYFRRNAGSTDPLAHASRATEVGVEESGGSALQDGELMESLSLATQETAPIRVRRATFTYPVRCDAPPSSPKETADKGLGPSDASSDHGSFCVCVDELTVSRGECVFVVGAKGSGKSSLLMALLGEMCRARGSAHVERSVGHHYDGGGEDAIGFASQVPWLPDCSLRDAVIFNRPFSESRYRAVIDACCLYDDILRLEGGDSYVLAQGAQNVSSGQRRRIALARAVYSYPEAAPTETASAKTDIHSSVIDEHTVYLLDQPFDGADLLVAFKMFRRLFCRSLARDSTERHGLLHKAATIVTLERLSEFHFFLQKANDEGLSFDVDVRLRIVDEGVVGPDRDIGFNTPSNQPPLKLEQTSLHVVVPDMDSNSGTYGGESYQAESASMRSALFGKNTSSSGKKEASPVKTSLLTADSLAAAEQGESFKRARLSGSRSLVSEGKTEVGGLVTGSTYAWFFGVLRPSSVLSLAAFTAALGMLTDIGSEIWLTYWSSPASSAARESISSAPASNAPSFLNSKTLTAGMALFSNGNASLNVFLIICAIHLIMQFGHVFLETYLALAVCRRVHRRFIGALLSAPFWFYDTFSLGILVNRLNADIQILDGGPLFLLVRVLLHISKCAIFIVVMLCFSPPSIILIPLTMLGIYRYAFRYYRVATRAGQRAKLLAYSPLCENLSEIERGAVVIRALGCRSQYIERQIVLTDRLVRAQFVNFGIVHWASLWIKLLVYPLAVTSVINVSIEVSHALKSTKSPMDPSQATMLEIGALALLSGPFAIAAVGFLKQIAARLPGSIENTTLELAAVEQNLTSVERIREFIRYGESTLALGRGSTFSRRCGEAALESGSMRALACGGAEEMPHSLANNAASQCGLKPSHAVASPEGLQWVGVEAAYARLVCEPGQARREKLAESTLEASGVASSWMVEEDETLALMAKEVSEDPRSAREIKRLYRGAPIRLRLLPPSLVGLSASIGPGERVGVVGRTGAGKSTLLLSLLNLVPVVEGQIVLDGVPLNQLSEPSLRRLVGVLPPAPLVLDGWTLREYLDPDHTFSDSLLVESLERVNLKEVVERLSDGLQSLIRPSKYDRNGVKKSLRNDGSPSPQQHQIEALSDSQLRLLSVARLTLTATPYRVLVIDEPPLLSDGLSQTESDLESPMETRNIGQLLRKVFPEAMIIIIAHHYLSIRDCDRLWIMSKGRLAKDLARPVIQSQEDLVKALEQADTDFDSKDLI